MQGPVPVGGRAGREADRRHVGPVTDRAPGVTLRCWHRYRVGKPGAGGQFGAGGGGLVRAGAGRPAPAGAGLAANARRLARVPDALVTAAAAAAAQAAAGVGHLVGLAPLPHLPAALRCCSQGSPVHPPHLPSDCHPRRCKSPSCFRLLAVSILRGAAFSITCVMHAMRGMCPPGGRAGPGGQGRPASWNQPGWFRDALGGHVGDALGGHDGCLVVLGLSW